MAPPHISDSIEPFPGYTLAGEVARDRRRVLSRGIRQSDRAPVLLKSPADQAAGAEVLEREYRLLRSLELDGVPRAVELVRGEGGAALVLEDAGGERLRLLIPAGGMDLATWFRQSLQMVRILQGLHHVRVIHKDLNPDSVLVDPGTGRLTLIDFAIASRAPAEHQELRHPGVLEGSIAYLSPEQTGRMNRAIDYRSDFYSLGVTFYEMLTGRLPFESADPLELIHGHIARTPRPPRELRPEIPAPLSDMVMKLLAKAAEDRYQSAARLEADLAGWQAQWSGGKELSALGTTGGDVADRFLLPQRLYGREQPLARLTAAVEQVGSGPTRLVLVSGYAGVGKSSLIRELYRPLIGRRGYFTAGKFDQVMRTPYGALLVAVRDLIQQLLTENEDQVAAWRNRLADALGPGAAVLAEVVPEIASILGRQPPAPALGPAETQNRFRMVVQQFLQAVARRGHPLVVFLDDLQWADSATLKLLEPLLGDPEIEALLLIGAYRDNEVDPVHPLTRTIRELAAAGIAIERVPLDPLELSDLASLVRDTLHCDAAEADPLARLLSRKTGGNPFFVGQFLKALREADLLRFDYARECWTFEMDAIAKAGMTDNVIDLMTRKIQRLQPRTQRALTFAACIGNPFDQATLAAVSEQPPEAVAADLREALDEGLIHPAGTGYAFLHDRVQQSAYALIPDERKRAVHLAVGRLLFAHADPGQVDERIFDLVHHLNLGRGLIAEPAERLALARLNLSAGRKAKAATAHEAALDYFLAGVEQVGDGPWASDYELAFALHLEAAESRVPLRKIRGGGAAFHPAAGARRQHAGPGQGLSSAQSPVRDHVALWRRAGDGPRMPRDARPLLSRWAGGTAGGPGGGDHRHSATAGRTDHRVAGGPAGDGRSRDPDGDERPDRYLGLGLPAGRADPGPADLRHHGPPVAGPRQCGGVGLRLRDPRDHRRPRQGRLCHGPRVRQAGAPGQRAIRRPAAPRQDPPAVSRPREPLVPPDGQLHSPRPGGLPQRPGER